MQPTDPASHPPIIRCQSCGADVSASPVGGVCPNCRTPIQQTVHAQAMASHQAPIAQLGFAFPILVTIFCCLIGGIIAIVYTSKANTAAVVGNRIEFEGARRVRNGWMIASAAIGGGIVLLYIVLFVVALIASAASAGAAGAGGFGP